MGDDCLSVVATRSTKRIKVSIHCLFTSLLLSGAAHVPHPLLFVMTRRHCAASEVRRSTRFQKRYLTSTDTSQLDDDIHDVQPEVVKRIKEDQSDGTKLHCLPRTRELQLQAAAQKMECTSSNLVIIGVDEAGRGPLAGPIVAAAAVVPTNINGIVDSKKITKEDERERLFEELLISPGIRYAVAIVSPRRIDEINILQATLEGMKMAVEAVMKIDSETRKGTEINVASAVRNEMSYVITGGTPTSKIDESYYALIDGNKIPKDMSCPSETLVKGDGREYSIAAASILAKVTRDRLMHEYDKLYPKYNLSQHKGYPTAAHMDAVKEFGASPIHRRTFAPLKHMTFDEEGNIIR